MKPKVYIETSVVSYYVSRGSRDVVIAGRQQSTQDFWGLLADKVQPFVSALVIKEASRGNATVAEKRIEVVRPFPVLQTTAAAERLAQSLIDNKGIPEEYPEDALHIAVAAIAGMDFIVTWKFSHINNPFTKMMIRHTVEKAGLECPEIISPDAFLGD
jgi:hypothetical protein